MAGRAGIDYGFSFLANHERRSFCRSVGSEVGDMDPLAPGLQFVDLTGDFGDEWYYRVVATNGACEGP